MEDTSRSTFTGRQAAIAQTALREALGMPPEQFSLQAFIGMISDEIQLLREAGKSDDKIAALIEQAVWVEIAPQAITEFYASPEGRGHHR